MTWRYAHESDTKRQWSKAQGDASTNMAIPFWRQARGRRQTGVPMMLTQDSKLDLQGRMHRLTRLVRLYRRRLARNGRTWLFSGWGMLVTMVAAVSSLTLNPTWRHWTGHLLANVFILGGIVAAPLVSLVGWIGVAQPPRTALHEVAPTLFASALIWLLVAIVAAHADSRRGNLTQR